MQENGMEQPKVYRRTRSRFKIRCTLTEIEQTRYRNNQLTESEKAEFHTPAIPNMARNCIEENSLENVSPDLVQLTVPTRDTQASAFFIQNQKKGRKLQIYLLLHLHLHLHWKGLRNKVLTLQDPESQQERTLESQPVHLVIFTCKDTSASGLVDYQFKMLNFELYILYSRAELAICHV